MPSPNRGQSGFPSLRVAIERYFQVALYLMVLTGFATLAGTGTLDLPTVVLVGMALLVRGILLGRRTEAQIPERWTTYLTLAYGVFYAADITVLSGSFLTSTVRLVLFGMVVRVFSVQKERDHYMLTILSFLMVLSAAVLTVDSVFLFAFCGFLLTAVATFILMEMRRSARSVTIPARETGDPLHRRMAFFLAGASPALVILILTGASAIFFVLPRVSVGYLSSYAAGNDMATGFSDRVQLGRIGQIQQSSAVVMHVQIDGDTRGSYDLKWRGVALSMFDGKSWSNPSEQFDLSRQADSRFALWQAATKVRAAQPIHYRVLMEPIGTNVFFFATRPRYLTGNYRLLATDRTGSIYNLDTARPVSLYEADSDLGQPAPDDLRRANGNYPADFALTYLPPPASVDPRIQGLAQQVTSSAANNYDRAVDLERYLTTNFTYTLELPGTVPRDPLAHFLFERKQGHCEYFASAMAIMLRTLGIPSRLVNGFRTTEFNDLTSQYVIRASSAHSWVEAYFPGYGWIGFDPTPAALPAGHTGWNRAMLYVDAMASFWREWVVNYDTNHQKALGDDAIRGSRSLLERVRNWSERRYNALLAKARQLQKQVTRSPRSWALPGVLVAILVLMLANVRNLSGWIRRRRLQAHPEEAPALAATMWYERVARWLARQGCRRSPPQTPREFLMAIDDPALRRRVEEFTAAYESARFGENCEQARRLPELYEEITTSSRG